jgi:ribosomal protein L17
MAYYAPNNNPQSQPQSPVDMVKTFRSQGMDNNQIIQALQRQGLSSNIIFDAMNQVETAPSEQDQGQDRFQSYPVFSQNAPEPPRKATSPRDSTTDEELIESIVEEKWNSLVKDLTKIIEWKNVTANKITSMEQKIEDTRREIEKLQSAVIAKIDDYDKNISSVGAEVKAMEKVFSKVLPVFAENVSELSRIAKDLKTPAKK